MPYRITEAPVRERQKELDALLEGKPMRFRTSKPDQLRYRIHEALSAAKLLNIEPYNKLTVTLSVRPPYVYATPKVLAELDVTIEEVDSLLDVAGARVVYPDDISAFAVVGRARSEVSQTELHFPNFSGDISPVMKWAEASGYEVITEPVLILRRVT